MEEKELINQITEQKKEKVMPLVALRGKVLFPGTFLNFDVGRQASISAVDKAAQDRSEIFIASQKNAFIDTPKPSEILSCGVIARIKQIVKVQNGNIKVSVEAIARAKIKSFIPTKGYFTVAVEESPYLTNNTENEVEAHFRVAKNAFYEYALADKRISKEMLSAITEKSEANEFVDNAISIVNFKDSDVQGILLRKRSPARRDSCLRRSA